MKAFENDANYVSRMHELGSEFAKQKDYSTALQIYADLKQQYPGHDRAPGVQRSVIQTYLEMKDQDAVGRELDVFFADYAEHPKFVEQAQHLAADFAARKEADWVIEVYAGLLETLPEHDRAIRFHAGMTKAVIQKGSLDEADILVDLLERDYQSRPDYAGVVNDLGETYRTQKEYARAINVFRKTLAAESSQEDALTAYAGIAKAGVWLSNKTIDPNTFEVYEMDQNIAAIEEMDPNSFEASKADPNNPLIAEVDPNVLSQNDIAVDSIIQKLIAHYEDIQRQDYRVFEIAEEYYFRGQKAILTGNKQRVQSDMTRAVEVWEKNLTSYADSGYQCLMYFFMAGAYQRMESYETAIHYYQKVIHEWPQFEKNWFAQYMIVECNDDMYIKEMLTEEDAKIRVIEACRELLEHYPDCKVSEFVQGMLTNYEAM